MRLRHIPEADTYVPASRFVNAAPAQTKGRWQEAFPGPGPIFLEIGMGKGKFITETAVQNPGRNYIGMERYPSVLYRAIQKLERMEDDVPRNLILLSCDARQLPEIFEPGEISGIYLNFSDPWPKKRQARRRLTSDVFRQLYAEILPQSGPVFFRTDNADLFDFSLAGFREDPSFEVLSVSYDLHADPVLSEGLITTEYEDRFSQAGKPVMYLEARKK